MARGADLLRRLIALRRAGARELARVEDAALANVLRSSLEATRNVERLIASDRVRDAEQLLAALDLLLAETAIRQTRILTSATDSIFDVSLALHTETVGLFGITTPRRLLALSRQFDATHRADLRSDNYTRWIRRIPKETLAPESALRRAIAESVLEGRSTKAVVRDFLAQSRFDKTFQTAGQILRSDVAFKNLPLIEQKIAPLYRALRVMRTEIGRLDNTVGIGFDEAAGMDRFINLGIGDDRQSEICAEATAQDPMTLPEWRASEWGIAPRHPNCRCAMFGVPPDVREQLSVLALDRLEVTTATLLEA